MTQLETVHPMVGVTFWSYVSFMWTIEKYFGVAAIILAVLLNLYMFMFALKGWGVIKLDPWLEDIVFFLDSEDGENVFFLSWAEDILHDIKGMLMEVFEIEEYTTANEEFFYIYEMIVYPWLWIGTSFFGVEQLLTQPFYALLFVIDK